MDSRRMFKEMMMSGHNPNMAGKVPYLLCPQGKPGEYSQNEKNWLKRREEARRKHAPIGWWNYYQDCLEIKIRDGDSLALWRSQSTMANQDLDKGSVPFILFLHGGGYSGLTWAPMVDELSRLIVAEYGALDLRGHGESQCKDENNMSLEILTQDVLDAIEWMKKSPKLQLDGRPLILVGHSMGGALAVNVALSLQESNQVRLSGLIVLDVVEGSALLALSSMQFFLVNRPHEFGSIEEAIQWCTRSGQTKNVDSARISMTGQLLQKYSGKLATQFVPHTKDDGIDPSGDTTETETSAKRVWQKFDNTIESGEPTTITAINSPLTKKDLFVWRIDLSRTECYWKGWFEGLSKKFLTVRCPKLLMLAGVDRLDKELTVAQMQGKFQMHVFHQVGHVVHEDAPDKAAECVTSFLCRQRVAIAKGTVPSSLPGC